MATAANEVLEDSSVPEDVIVEQNHETPPSEMQQSHGDPESQPIFSEEEVRSTLETSASTGKYWQNWEKLKSILSYHLKQVLSEYPEAKMTSEQQVSSLGETFQELVKRLDDALHSFDDGPPFTLQRLCEILLSARSIYPKLSKLCLALEKNLLVTSTLTITSDTYPLATKQDSNGSYEGNGNAPPPQIGSVENGVQEEGDRDEVMTDAQETEAQETEAQETEAQVAEAQVTEAQETDAQETDAQETEAGENMPMDMETIEDVVRSSPPNPPPTVDS